MSFPSKRYKRSVLSVNLSLALSKRPLYEQYSVQAYNDYKAVAGSYRDAEGEIDILRDEVIAAAIPAAAKLYAYACYNERRAQL